MFMALRNVAKGLQPKVPRKSGRSREPALSRVEGFGERSERKSEPHPNSAADKNCKQNPRPGKSLSGDWKITSQYRLFLDRIALLFAEVGFHRGSDAGQHLFCRIGKLPGGLKLQILLECLRRPCGSDHLVAT